MLNKYFEVREKVQSNNAKPNKYLHLRFIKDKGVKQRVIEEFEDIRIKDGHMDVYTPLYDYDYAVSVALSYGSKVKIIAPIEIREAFLKELKKMNSIYFKGEDRL
jgi:predicted DNA-binding transcriptional regulator YafY